jgi:hypothetical protein
MRRDVLMGTAVAPPRLRIAFAGTFSVRFEARAKLIAENIHRAAVGDPPVNPIPTSAE